MLLACLSAAAVFGWQEFLVRFHYQGLQTGLFCTGSRFPPPPPSSGTYVLSAWRRGSGPPTTSA